MLCLLASSFNLDDLGLNTSLRLQAMGIKLEREMRAGDVPDTCFDAYYRSQQRRFDVGQIWTLLLNALRGTHR